MAAKKELLLIEIREDGARVVKRNIEGIGKAGKGTTDQMDKLKTVLAGLVSAKVLKDTIMLADAYANMMNRLRVVTETTWELHAAMEGVFKMSRETRTSMEANIDMFARVAINTKQMGFNYRDVLKFAKQLNHAIILSGVTAREAQWGMVQFSQALASNALRGDELRAILEQLPIVTDVIAAHFKVTRGELRELGFQGLITADKIILAFEEAEKSLAERFAKRIPTIDQGFTVLRSSVVRFIGEMDQGWQVTTRFASAILWVGDHMETFGRFAFVAGTVLGTIYLKNLILIVAQMRLFSLELLRVNPLMTALMIAGAGMVVYSDRIKIAADSTATLKDVFKALGENAGTAYKTIRDGLAGMLDGVDLSTNFQVTFQSVITDAATFIDKFTGLFVGAGQVVALVFKNIPNYAKIAWNGILSGIERVSDTIRSLFKTIGDMFRIFGLNMKSAMISLSGSVQQALAGNIKQAKIFADQAAHSFEQAATQGFSNFSTILGRNLEEAASEDSLAGAKFKVETAGESMGDAFARGFDQSTLLASGLEDIFNRAKDIAGARAGGGDEDVILGALPRTPGESKLYKELTGDISALKAETESLNNLMYKQLYVSIIQVDKALRDGSITAEDHKEKLSALKTEMLLYINDVKVLKTLRDRGRITNEDYAASVDVVRERQEKLSEQFKRTAITIEQYDRKLEELRLRSLKTATDISSGFERGFISIGLEISNFADMAEKTVTNAFKSMEDALVSFVTTGKVDFKSLVDSMLADLTRLLARKAIVALIGGLAGDGGGGGIISSLVGASSTGTGQPGMDKPRALGGQVSPGMSYLVGERRPEIFTPAQPGQVTANPVIQQPAQEGAVTIINVSNEEDAIAAMQSAEGQRVIRNEIRTYSSGR